MTNKAKTIVTFTVRCDSLIQAAELENALIAIDIKDFTYKAEQVQPTPRQKGNGHRRHHIVTDEVRREIRAAGKAYPNASINQLRAITKLPHSSSTFSRVLGRHA